MNSSALDNTGNQSYTHSHGNGSCNQPINSRDPGDHTAGEAFMECNYDVSEHYSNNNEYIYGDPSHLSVNNEFINEEDEQALRESFVFIPTVKTVRSKTNDVAPIAMVKVKTINKIQVDRPLVCLLDTGSTGTMIQSRALPPGVVPNISPENV